MKISGILEQNSTVTLPRLLERIFDTDRPGELLLKHQSTGEDAVLTIKHGEVSSTRFGELKNDEAMRAIGQTFPWIYEFVASGDTQGDGRLGGPNLVSSAPKTPLRAVGARVARPVARPVQTEATEEINQPLANSTPVAPEQTPAIQAAPEEEVRRSATPPLKMAKARPRPMEAEGTAENTPEAEISTDSARKTRQDRPYLRTLGVRYAGEGAAEPGTAPAVPPQPVLDLRSLHTAESLRPWVLQAGTGSLRFFDFDGTRFGELTEEEWAYFRADHAFITRMANNIGAAIGFSSANMVAVVEPQRAACYWTINDGFAGAYRGTDMSVVDFIAKF